MEASQPLGLKIIFIILTVFFSGFFVPNVIAQQAEEAPEEAKQDIPKTGQNHLPSEEGHEDDTWFQDGYDYGILKDEESGIGQEWRTEEGTYSSEWEGGRAEGDLFYDFNNEPSSAPLPEIETDQPETPETETEYPEDKPSTDPAEGATEEDGQAPL